MPRRRRIRYPLDGKTAIYLKDSSSGMVAGIPHAEDPRDPHLTITSEGSTVGRHLTYFEGEEKKRVPLGKASPAEIAQLAKFVASGFTSCSSDQAAWVPSRALVLELAALPGVPDLDREVVLPPMILRELGSPTLDDPAKWTKTTIGHLVQGRDVIAISVFDGRPHLVFPTGGGVVKLSFDELLRNFPFLFGLTGFGALYQFVTKGLADRRP